MFINNMKQEKVQDWQQQKALLNSRKQSENELKYYQPTTEDYGQRQFNKIKFKYVD